MAVAEDAMSLGEVKPAGRLRFSPPLLAALVLFVLAPASLPIDLPLAHAFRSGDLPGDVARIIHLSEVFAHGAGIALILLTAWTLDQAHWRRLVRIAACAYGSGLLANLGKLVLARSRPNEFGDGVSIFDTFVAFAPHLSGSMDHWRDPVQGFPSAHAATAVGFGVALGAAYPRGRWLFLIFAALASFQRVVAGAHFLSDTLAGAAVGCLGAALFLKGGWASRGFDRLETNAPSARPETDQSQAARR